MTTTVTPGRPAGVIGSDSGDNKENISFIPWLFSDCKLPKDIKELFPNDVKVQILPLLGVTRIKGNVVWHVNAMYMVPDEKVNKYFYEKLCILDAYVLVIDHANDYTYITRMKMRDNQYYIYVPRKYRYNYEIWGEFYGDIFVVLVRKGRLSEMHGNI